ncbi:peptidoglycan-associated lipoprotein Pal [Neptunomonas antarctica]|uniref:Peptidoglycan-associated lipoprotein n=1 Tax=Neptunomonas antarctica TaxID=619304 RepID=A0A1N7KAZ7_9GAMM|nr:peptidoglycan-associated lipoprotein Pal [Neptunomonas antarctica]SIS58777.1 peptidoglycan-associated lipoprotein [Neptunomonas antarctica]
MRVSNVTKAVSLALSVAWIVGCSSPSTLSDEDTSSSTADGSASTYGTGSGNGVNGSGAGGSVDVANLQTVFYFDFDTSSVRNDSIADLEAHAQYLSMNPTAAVRVEGHADERGTREYNMALGERRAKAVERFLAVNGVSAGQVESISYGEEKPAMMGSDDSSLSQNRRVELKYVSR